jgi:hypothetical protein
VKYSSEIFDDVKYQYRHSENGGIGEMHNHTTLPKIVSAPPPLMVPAGDKHVLRSNVVRAKDAVPSTMATAPPPIPSCHTQRPFALPTPGKWRHWPGSTFTTRFMAKWQSSKRVAAVGSFGAKLTAPPPCPPLAKPFVCSTHHHQIPENITTILIIILRSNNINILMPVN